MIRESLHQMGVRRTVLCVPAGDPRRIAKALASGADEVVIDLEDAVAPEDKAAARDVLAGFDWAAIPVLPMVAVRVNGPGTAWCHRDLETAVALAPISSVVLPKVESPADIGFVERLLDGLEAEVGRSVPLGVQALIETAAGLTSLAEIVSGPRRLISLLLGYADLAASLGRGPVVPPGAWLPAQEAVLWHARSAGLAAIDGPFLGVQDDEHFRNAAGLTAELGYDAKWAIHPRQIDALHGIFSPSPDAVAHAQAVLSALAAGAAEGRGAVQLDGQLLDEAMAVAARRTLAKVSR